MKGKAAKHVKGITLIETIIMLAMVIIVLTVALPIYSNFIVRTRVTEVLSIGESAKTIISEICRSEPDGTILAKASAAFPFEKSEYLDSIDISGFCSAPVITLAMQNSGASIDPVLRLTGEKIPDSGGFFWTCAVVSEPNILTPDYCKN